MFPLERNQVIYCDTNIGHILDQFKLPLFQHTKNELHVNEIYDMNFIICYRMDLLDGQL